MKKVLCTISVLSLLFIGMQSCTPTDTDDEPSATGTEQTGTDPIGTNSQYPYPETTTLIARQEGDVIEYPATLAISEKGYGIYVLEDFELIESSGYDNIKPKATSEIMETIQIFIYPAQAGSAEPTPEADETDGVGIEADRKRIELDGNVFDIKWEYPVEASDNIGILTTMVNSIVGPKS
ncbi:MAG: hypothetical protein LBT74_07065 [Acidobacteriota bacterium]|nr:hypothetical protein [Acidobacteriota bacterium]